MEFIVEKIGMSRTIGLVSTPVTLLRVLPTKVCEVNGERAFVAYSATKAKNKAIAGQQKNTPLAKSLTNSQQLALKTRQLGI